MSIVFPTVKKITGRTIAEMIVMTVRDSIAAATDVAELIHARKIFL
jgi:hypothetical protein